jgi:hypothetical protein
LMYCAITPRFGWVPASSALPPFVELDIHSPPAGLACAGAGVG